MRAVKLLHLILTVVLTCPPVNLSANDALVRASLNPLAKLEPAAFSAFIERPLFSPSRRPPAVPQTEEIVDEEEGSDEPVEVTLAGITKGPLGTIARLLGADGTGHSVRMGDDVLGWTVQSVDDNAVALSKDGKAITLRLFQTESAQGVPADETGIVAGNDDERGVRDIADTEGSEKMRKVRVIKQN